MITVGVCSGCNQKKSPLDEYLRDCLIGDVANKWNPVVKENRERMARCVNANRSILSRQATERGVLKPMFTTRGLYAGMLIAVPIDLQMLAGSLIYIVRGLCFHLRQARIPEDYVFALTRAKTGAGGLIWEDAQRKSKMGRITIGRNVFESRYKFWGQDTCSSSWYLRFYNSTLFLVYVTSAENARKYLIPSLAEFNRPTETEQIFIVNVDKGTAIESDACH